MISIIIPTYKNKKQLLKNLKTNLPYLKGCEIIIVNDDPNDSLVIELKNFSSLTLIENDHNLGFGLTVNCGVQKAKNKYILLLNNDVILHDDKFKKLIEKFQKDSSIFAISFAQIEKDSTIVGHNTLFWKNGMIFHKALNTSNSINAWADGGSCMIDREKFLDLQGFDELFSPFYWEDIDISYRAWKKGYTIQFSKEVLVDHHHESTIGAFFTKDQIKTIAYRNQLLFIWKNISDPMLLISHFLFLPWNIIYYLFKGEYGFIKGFINAIQRILKIHRSSYIISDESIFKKFHE